MLEIHIKIGIDQPITLVGNRLSGRSVIEPSTYTKCPIAIIYFVEPAVLPEQVTRTGLGFKV